jgi:hypothetical protein
VTWEPSSKIFLHRSQCRKLVTLIQDEPDHVYLPLTLKKIPTTEGLAAEGGELFATAVVDISSIIHPGENVIHLSAKLQGDGMDGEKASPIFQLQFTSEFVPIVEQPPLGAFQQPVKTKETGKIVDSGLLVSSKFPNRDILQELRDEISSTIERIAQEYVSIFPLALASEASSSHNPHNNNGNDDVSTNSQANNHINPQNNELEDRKEKFLTFLVNNGLFQELQENLRMKIQLLVKERFSARGRALGRSETLREFDKNISLEQEKEQHQKENMNLLQNILAELYSFLSKECTLVMNSLFKSTIIQKDLQTIDNPALINDEVESDIQIFNRLLRQGEDAFADQKYSFADMIYMERLQLIDHCVSLGSNLNNIHSGYSSYAEYLLKRSAQAIYNNRNDNESYQSLLRKAREALAVAHKTPLGPNEGWETSLLYVVVLIQLNQLELAEEILLLILSNQLKGSKPEKPLEMETWNEFGGYESDALCPVHPRVYAVLASLLYIRGKPIECRKALILANRCTNILCFIHFYLFL